MKGENPRITLLGSNSGNNLGDAAILSSILENLTHELPGVEFYVPSTKPSFVNENYGSKYKVKGVNVMPWTASIRLLGIPTFWCIAKSDAALICDGIIFGKKLLNPLFNFLITLIFIVPWAKLCGCKMVCYSCGIGPFPSKLSRLLAQFVLNNCDLVMMREPDSKKLAEEIGVTRAIELTGDAAYINPVSDANVGERILKEEGVTADGPLLGVNVTSYLDTWLSPEERAGQGEDILDILAKGINDARAQLSEKFGVVVVCTHPMDLKPAYKLASSIDGTVIHNLTHLSHDIQAVMRRCELFMGMRFHSLVLASAVEVPVLGLIYAPKVRSLMDTLKSRELSLELSALNPDTVSSVLSEAWTRRAELKRRQLPIINEMKAGAVKAHVLLRERLFPEISTMHTTSACAVNQQF